MIVEQAQRSMEIQPMACIFENELRRGVEETMMGIAQGLIVPRLEPGLPSFVTRHNTSTISNKHANIQFCRVHTAS